MSRNFVLMSNDQYSSTSSLPKDHLSRTTDINSASANVFSVPVPKQVPTPHELLRHKRLPASRQIAVTVSVGEEVMNSTATRLFPRQFHIACCIRLSQLGHRFIQGNGQSTFLRILCAAPTFLEAPFSPPDERRGNGLENLLGSPPPPLKQTVFPMLIRGFRAQQ